MKHLHYLFLLFVVAVTAQEKTTLDYFLPKDVTYNKDIPTPKSVFNFELGEWHANYSEVVLFMNTMANSSNRVQIKTTGYTHENRPLQLLTISSPKNIANIEEIQRKHLAITESNLSKDELEKLPVVVYLGYSIHGNEPSGTGAGIAMAYYLAAAQGKEIDELLENTIILLDPCLNPDGFHRFSTWVNSNRSRNLITDSNDREFNEVWPGGRFNHYWFDLNRDWLPLQHPESQARIKSFQAWMPNVLGDFHEMGTNSSYFFQPGVPSRTHPLTPIINQQLTKSIAKYHAKSLDKVGSLYYTEESFDDFYYGKGSTYPDVNGSVGILFEQASSRGHAQQSVNGILTFPFTIKNQFLTSISTVQAAYEMRKDLINYQYEFFNKARLDSKSSKIKGYVIGSENDATRLNELATILEQHKVKFQSLKEDMTIKNKKFNKDYSFIIPTDQKNIKLIEAMFDKRTQFKDSLFYDISAWSLDLAFNLNFESLASLNQAGSDLKPVLKKGSISAKSDVAYVLELNDFKVHKLLYQLLAKGLRVSVAKKPFIHKGKTFSYGSLLIPSQNQKMSATDIYNFLEKATNEYAVDITGVETGLTDGINLGSPNFVNLTLPKVAMVVGDGIDPSDAGEVWHMFDTRMQIPLTKIDIDHIARTNLSKYNVLILVDGNYNDLGKENTQKIEDWIKDGGTVIGYNRAVKWLSSNKMIDVKFKSKDLVAKNISFIEKDDYKGAQVIGGAIFETKLDLSHPLNYGIKNAIMPIFRTSTLFLESSENSYDNPISYSKTPLISGYISKENLELIKGSVPFNATRKGSGRILSFTDNTNFRAFWFGTEKIFWNSLFFSKIM